MSQCRQPPGLRPQWRSPVRGRKGLDCKRCALLAGLCLLGVVPCILNVQAASVRAEGGSHIQRFRYDAEASFAILALPGVPTDLQLAPDEHIIGFAVGDTIQWVVEELAGHVFIKPLRPALFTAGTLVTDRRTYQLTLRSVASGEDWMQRVTWSYPDLVVLRTPTPPLPHGAQSLPVMPAASPAGGTPGEAGRGALPGNPVSAVGPVTRRVTDGLDPAQLDFDYRVSGDAPFRPQVVFDDGRSTWLRVPPREALPALFQDSEDGAALLNYAVRGDWLVIPRILPRFILKLGRQEVQVQRHPGAVAQGAARGRFWN